MGRSPSSSSWSCCDEIVLKRGPWTPEEDQKLVSFIIQQHGHAGSWRALPKLAGLNRCGKSCRLRWTNYLRPDIKRGKFSEEEQQTILNLHSIIGNKWSIIASHLPGRTDNEIKNFWNTHLKKKLIQMGFDPITHMPTTNYNNTISPHFLPLQHLQNHLLFDSPPLEHQVEALQMATLQEYLHHLLQLSPPFTPTFQPLQYDRNMSAPFAHFPDSEIYGVSDDPTSSTAVSGGRSGPNSMWVFSSSSNNIAPPPLRAVEANSESESAPAADGLIFEDYSLFSEIDP